MAQLIVRRLDDKVVRALKIRAAENGRSAEEEHREILRDVLLKNQGCHSRPSFKELLLTMPNVGNDSDFARSPDIGRDVSL